MLDLKHIFAYYFLCLIFKRHCITKRLRINAQIHAPFVRLIDENQEQLGVVSITEALKLAQERGYDLAEVAPNVTPPVCKLLDYGKYQYRQSKIEQKHRSKQHKAEIKGIRLSLRTGDHDLLVKVNHAERFIKDGHTVKVALIFRGRELAHQDLARDKMFKFYEALKDKVKVEEEPKVQGHNMFMILHPLAGGKP